MHLSRILAFSLTLLLTSSTLRAQEAAPAEAADLLKIGDQFADEKKYDEALISYKNAYEKLVPIVRKLEFKEPVEPRLMTRSELREYMAKEFQTEYTPQELTLLDRSLKAFGMVPRTVDVRELMINLLTEEVGGFYNPKSNEMYLIREEVKQGSLLARLFSGPEFDPESQRVTLSHEMTHALADQHFDLVALDEAASGNDDMMMAISALVEGEATLVMMSELLDEPDLDVTQMEPSRIDFTFRIMNMAMPLFGGRTLRSAPPVFREALMFPYHQGCVFVANLTNRGGWDAIDRAYKEPPVSTEQILHWEKYEGEQRDDPVAIELPKLTDALDAAWKSLGTNTLGELQTRVLFDSLSDSITAAEGWDGDRYEIFEHEDGQLALAWFTTWDSADDAREFCSAAAPWFSQVVYQAATKDESRSGLKQASAQAGELWAEHDAAEPFVVSHGDCVVHIELRDRTAVVVAGFSADESKSLATLMWRSQQAPITLRR